MKKVVLGKTGLRVSEVGFGGIPIFNLPNNEAVKIIKESLRIGINFIDTAYAYGDSEEKIGQAIKGLSREEIVIASKSNVKDKQGFLEQINTSLKRVGTDYIDIYQHHGVNSEKMMVEIMGPGGAFEGMLQAIKDKKVRYAGFSSHFLPVAKKMLLTGKFAVMQFPFNFVDNEAEKELLPLAEKLNVGFIGMKPLGGGVLEKANLCFRYLMQYKGIVPDPGISKIEEVREIIDIYENPRPLNEEEETEIAQLRDELGNEWCHLCSYCDPCLQGIKVPLVLAAKGFLKRSPLKKTMKMLDLEMQKVEDCIKCGICVERCPYNLNIPELLEKNKKLWPELKNSIKIRN